MPEGNTVRLHRVFATKPEKVFRAFLDADAMAKWLPPYGFTCKVHHFEAKVGGSLLLRADTGASADCDCDGQPGLHEALGRDHAQ